MTTRKKTQPKAEEKKFTLKEAKTMLEILAAQKKSISEQEKSIHEAINQHCGKEFHEELKNRGQAYGDVTLDVDGVKATMQIKKSVDWDSDLLFLVAKEMGPQRATEIMTIECKIPESNFKKISSSDPLYKKILEARTVKYSNPKFIFPENE